MYYCFAVLLATVFLIELAGISGVEGFKVTVDPTYIQLPKWGSREVRVTCTAESKQMITGCQFRIWYVGKSEEGVLLDVSGTKGLTNVVVPNPNHPDTNYTAELNGDRFNDGTCYVNLRNVLGDHLLLGCKLTNKYNQSAMNTMAIFFSDGSQSQLKMHKETLFVKRGASVDLQLLPEYGYVSRNCSSSLSNGDDVTNIRHIKLNQQTNVVTFPNGSPASPRYTALKELNQGECGFTISNVTDKDNGVFFVVYSAFTWDATYHRFVRYFGAKAVILIVPSMNMTFSKSAREISDGEEKTVTCTARGIDPAYTRWSWWLDGTDITFRAVEQRQGQSSDGWSWPWEAGVSQTVTFTFSQEDHGKKLACWLENVKDSKWNLQKEKQISIKQMTRSGRYHIKFSQKDHRKKLICRLENLKDSKWILRDAKLIHVKQSTQYGNITKGTTSAIMSVAVSSTTSQPKESTESLLTPGSISSSKDSTVTPTATEPVTTHMSSTTTINSGESGDDSIPTHIIVTYAVLALVVFVVTAFMVDHTRRTKRFCFKEPRRANGPANSSPQEPVYEEIDESFPLVFLPPPSLPSRPEKTQLNQKAVPKVNTAEEPDYIVPNAPNASASVSLSPQLQLLQSEIISLNQIPVPKENAPEAPGPIIFDRTQKQVEKTVPFSTVQRVTLPKRFEHARPEKPGNISQDGTDDSLDADGYLMVIDEDSNQK